MDLKFLQLRRRRQDGQYLFDYPFTVSLLLVVKSFGALQELPMS